MKNIIYFENGIKHELLEDEIKLIYTLLINYGENAIEKYNINVNALTNLKSLFCEHLDW